MKKLLQGMFSSIPDAELITKTLDVQSAEFQHELEEATKNESENAGPPDVGDDSWLPS